MNSKHSLILALILGFAPRAQAQEQTVVNAPSPIESFEMVPGYPGVGLEYQARAEVGVNAVYYGLKYPQRWLAVPGAPAVKGTEVEVMNRASTELPPRATVGGRYLLAAGNNGILRFDRQASDRNTQAPSILATSGQHPFFPAAGIANGSDLMVLNDRVYWGEVDATRIQVWSHALTPGGPVILHAQTTYSGPSALWIKRFAPLSATESLALTFSGQLYVFRHDDLFTDLNGPSAMTLLASGVTGFANRQETYSHGGLSYPDTAVYFTVGHTLQVDSPPATLQRRRRDAFGGWNGPSTLFSTNTGVSGMYDTLTEVAVDGLYVYLRRAAVSNTIFGIRAGLADTTLRADSPNASPSSSLTTATIPANGNNLRTDNFHLYYAAGASVKRVPNDVEPIPEVNLDFEALGVEITQGVQSFDHRLDLVVGKRTFVRGYARQRVNQNTGVPAFSPFAQLRVFFRPALPLGAPEVELTAFPVAPLNLVRRPELGYGTLTDIRYDAAKSYLWELPPSFIAQGGFMRVEMQLSPGGASAETRDPANLTLDPALNNSVASVHHTAGGVYFRTTHTPSLLFMPVYTHGQTYLGSSLAAENLSAFLERTTSLLPVPGIRSWVALDAGFSRGGGKVDMERDAEEVLQAVVRANLFHKNPPGAGDTHWVAVVHEDAQNAQGQPVGFNGIGTSWEESVVRLSRAAGGGVPWNAPLGGRTLAHELGHNWNLDHVQGGIPLPEGPFENYPHPTSNFGVGQWSLPSSLCGYDHISNSAFHETDAGDLMSYMPTRWTSDYTWNHLLTTIPWEDSTPTSPPNRPPGVPEQAPPPNSFFVINGQYDSVAGGASLNALVCLPGNAFSDITLAESAEAAAAPDPVLVCRQRDAAGLLLSETPLSLRSDIGSRIFGQLISAHESAEQVEIVRVAGDLVIAGAAASQNPPTAAVTLAQIQPASGRVKVEWTASDADGDPLVFTLLYRATTTEGEVTRILRDETRDLSADISLDSLPGGPGHFVLITSDGFHTAEATSAVLNVGETAPTLGVFGLVAGQELDLWAAGNEGTYLCASANDADQGALLDPGTTFWNWTGPESGSAAGCGASLGKLFPGSYSLTASLTDAGGLTETKTIPFSVAPLTVPDSGTMTLDGVRDSADYANAPSVSWPLTDGSSATAGFSHHGGAMYIHIDGLPIGPNGVGAGLLFDLNNSGSAALESDDIAIEISAAGALTFWTGTTGAWTPAAAPAALVEAVTFTGDTHWAVEIRIPDAVLGGWNHFSRLRCYAQKTWPYDSFPQTSGHFNPSTWLPVSLGPRPAPAPQAPTAVAIGGGAVAPTVADVFTLDGTGSTTSRGDTAGLTYAWTQTGGPTVVLTGSDQATSSYSPGPVTAPVTLTFQLIVSADGLDSPPAEVTSYFQPAPETIEWTMATPGARIAMQRQPDGSVTTGCDAGYWFGENGILPGESAAALPVVGAMFELEASENLTNWQTIGRFPANSAGQVEGVDGSAPLFNNRFYRFRRAGQ